MELEEEIRILKFLYQIIKDKTVQRRFETVVSCDLSTRQGIR